LHSYRRVWLNDANAAISVLINWVIRDPDALLDAMRELWAQYAAKKEQELAYYEARRIFNDSYRAGRQPSVMAAAYMVMLNKWCFNGLYRVSQKGIFNSPWGKRLLPAIPEAAIMSYHRTFATRETEVSTLDYSEVITKCGPGDVVFCDPPYVPVSKTASFDDYVTGWNMADHAVLDRLAREAADRGAMVAVCASDTEGSRSRYVSAKSFLKLDVRRSISAKSAGRGMASEVMFLY